MFGRLFGLIRLIKPSEIRLLVASLINRDLHPYVHGGLCVLIYLALVFGLGYIATCVNDAQLAELQFLLEGSEE